MSTNGRTVDGDTDETPNTEQIAELRTQVELLSEENERLRDSYTRAKQTQYRQSALGLLTVGTIAAIGGLLVPTASTVLFALAGTGLFGGILTYYLTPEQFIAADVGRDVYAMFATNESALTAELALSEERIYVPVSAGSGPVRLFIPHDTEYVLPSDATLTGQTIIADDAESRGLALGPSGTRLLTSLEATTRGSLADSPAELASQLSDALVEQFELVDAADPDIDPDGGRCSVAIRGSVYGPIDQFDHPVVSLLATGFATGLSSPVRTSISSATNEDDAVVTLRWENASTAQ